MSSLLIVNQAQFGYHTDTYKYCKYLKTKYDISYICFDTGKPKVEMEGVNILYVPHGRGFLSDLLSFIKAVKKYKKQNTVNSIFIVYFKGAAILRCLFGKKAIIDIRTLTIGNGLSRKVRDCLLNIEYSMFSKRSVISDGVSKQLWRSPTHILPLGGESLSKDYKYQGGGVRLFYIGTLHMRKLELVIEALLQLERREPTVFNCMKFDIVGFGVSNDESNLTSLIDTPSLVDKVVFHGRKGHDEIQDIIKNCNVGLVYYPQIEQFEHQPPTKLFEYVLTGLPCVAVSTVENRKYIKAENGVLIDDDIDSIINGIIEISNRTYSQNNVVKSLEEYSWKNIVEKYFNSMIESVHD